MPLSLEGWLAIKDEEKSELNDWGSERIPTQDKE